MASQSIVLQNPAVLSPYVSTAVISPPLPRKHPNIISCRQPACTAAVSAPNAHRSTGPTQPLLRVVSVPPSEKPKTIASSSSAPVHHYPSTDKSQNKNSPPPQSSSSLLLTTSTRTATTLLVIALAASKLLAGRIQAIYGLLPQVEPLIYSSAGPAFFAAIGEYPTTVRLDTPFAILAGGMAKWLDIYVGVLSLRCLLTWFPNIPWDKQPLSAIRDLSDPYLSLFRSVIPPVFDSLDLSPLVAFTVLGTIGTILRRF